MTMTALILASGRSPALGYAKANLCIDNQTIMEKVTATVRSSGSEAIILSIGEENDPFQCSRRDVQPLLTAQRSCPVSVSVSKPNLTPMASAHQALKMVKPSGRVLLWPIEYPFADATIIKQLADSFTREADQIAVPKLGNHLGYPVLLGRASVQKILETQSSVSFRDFIRTQKSKVKEIATTDPRLIMSVNLPEQAVVLGIKSPGRSHQYS